MTLLQIIRYSGEEAQLEFAASLVFYLVVCDLVHVTICLSEARNGIDIVEKDDIQYHLQH